MSVQYERVQMFAVQHMVKLKEGNKLKKKTKNIQAETIFKSTVTQ